MKAKEQRNLPSTTPTPFLSRKTRDWRRGSKQEGQPEVCGGNKPPGSQAAAPGATPGGFQPGGPSPGGDVREGGQAPLLKTGGFNKCLHVEEGLMTPLFIFLKYEFLCWTCVK